MAEEYRVEAGQDPQALVQVLEDRIYEYNSDSIGRHDGRLFSRVVRDRNGRMVAGIAGWTWASACEITQLWVSEDVRKKGIGKRLLEAAEEEALASECRTILVKTYSFQAPFFYEKHGFSVAHVVENFPNGYRYYTLTKSL